jgi:hypothetical protein
MVGREAKDLGLGFGKGRQVPVFPTGDRYRMDMPVLVPCLILNVIKEMAVKHPCMMPDSPFSVPGNRFGFLQTSEWSQPNVQNTLFRGYIAHPLPVGAEEHLNDIRISEE